MNTSTTTKALKQDKQTPQKSYVSKAVILKYLFPGSVRILNTFGEFPESDVQRYFVLFPLRLLKIILKINMTDNILFTSIF